MKNATRYCADPAYYRSKPRAAVQNKLAAVAPKETITHHFFVSGIGQKKTVDAAKICGGAEIRKKQNQQHCKWIARFYYLGIYTPLEARVYCSHSDCPSIWATLSALLINILSGFLPVVFA